MEACDLIPGELYWLKSENGTGWKMVWDLSNHPSLVDIDSNNPVVYIQERKIPQFGNYHEFLGAHKHSDRVICVGIQDFQLFLEVMEFKHGPF